MQGVHALSSVLLLALFVVPAGWAHSGSHDAGAEGALEEGSYVNHTELIEGTLAPGAWRNESLAFGGTPLEADWDLLVDGEVDGALHFALDGPLGVVDSWDWTADHALWTGRLPASGFYHLNLTNPGPEPVAYRLYYDQTCDCTGKGLYLPRGHLWFNVDADAGDRVDFAFRFVPVRTVTTDAPWPETMQVRLLHVLRHAGSDGHWPDDFDVVSVQNVTFHPDDDHLIAYGNVSFTAPVHGRQTILVEASHDGDPVYGWQVLPVFSVEADKAAPVPWWAAGMALFGVALLRRR